MLITLRKDASITKFREWLKQFNNYILKGDIEKINHARKEINELSLSLKREFNIDEYQNNHFVNYSEYAADILYSLIDLTQKKPPKKITSRIITNLSNWIFSKKKKHISFMKQLVSSGIKPRRLFDELERCFGWDEYFVIVHDFEYNAAETKLIENITNLKPQYFSQNEVINVLLLAENNKLDKNNNETRCPHCAKLIHYDDIDNHMEYECEQKRDLIKL